MLVVFHEETINILNVCETRFRFEIKSDVKNKKKTELRILYKYGQITYLNNYIVMVYLAAFATRIRIINKKYIYIFLRYGRRTFDGIWKCDGPFPNNVANVATFSILTLNVSLENKNVSYKTKYLFSAMRVCDSVFALRS